jgi:hypothetical protein
MIGFYLRFTLSFRDVEDLLAERGIMISDEKDCVLVFNISNISACGRFRRWLQQYLFGSIPRM